MSAPEPILSAGAAAKTAPWRCNALLQQKEVRVTGLLTTITEGFERISMHGVRCELFAAASGEHRLAAARGSNTAQCVNPIYEARMEAAMRTACEQGIRRVAFAIFFWKTCASIARRIWQKLAWKRFFQFGSGIRGSWRAPSLN